MSRQTFGISGASRQGGDEHEPLFTWGPSAFDHLQHEAPKVRRSTTEGPGRWDSARRTWSYLLRAQKDQPCSLAVLCCTCQHLARYSKAGALAHKRPDPRCGPTGRLEQLIPLAQPSLQRKASFQPPARQLIHQLAPVRSHRIKN